MSRVHEPAARVPFTGSERQVTTVESTTICSLQKRTREAENSHDTCKTRRRRFYYKRYFNVTSESEIIIGPRPLNDDAYTRCAFARACYILNIRFARMINAILSSVDDNGYCAAAAVRWLTVKKNLGNDTNRDSN